MRLLDHVSITVRDIDRARPFYDAVMAALGVPRAYDRADAVGYGERNRSGDDGHTYLSVYQSPFAAPDPRRHWCFRTESEAMVRAFHAAGLLAGGRSAGEPGLRPNYHPGYYAAFLEDLEGNRVEAVYHGASATLPRRRLDPRYRARSRDDVSDRDVSPHRRLRILCVLT